MWSDSKEDQRWVMGLPEYGFAPHGMVHANDLYNYKTALSSIRYYTVGGDVWEQLRASLSYGRNRAGLQCSGGLHVPEYAGFNVLLTYRILLVRLKHREWTYDFTGKMENYI